MAAVAQQTTLETVQDYITDVRTLLQDTILPPRYDDPSLIVAFNVALREGRRLRPDLFVYHHGSHMQSYGPNVDTTEVHMEDQFRLAFVFGTAAHALARDQEDIQDQRASSFMGIFEAMLTGSKVAPIMGGPPAGGGQK